MSLIVKRGAWFFGLSLFLGLGLSAEKASAVQADQKLVKKVDYYYQINKKRSDRGNGCNWFRVLLAFGAKNPSDWKGPSTCSMTAYTSAEAKKSEAIWKGWTPVRTELKRLEDSKQSSLQQQQVSQSSSSDPASDADWLNDYKKNQGVFTPERHYVWTGRAARSSGAIVTSYSDLYGKTVGSARRDLEWSDIQPKLIDQNSPQAQAMSDYKKYANILGSFMIVHLFAVPKVLVGFPEKDKQMIAAKWGFNPSAVPSDGDYIELVYSTEKKWNLVTYHKIIAKHKKIAELGSLKAYVTHKGLSFTLPTVGFKFSEETDFGKDLNRLRLYKKVFNFFANNYQYSLGNRIPSQSEWQRVYSYTLGKHSPQFVRANVIAGHQNYRQALTQSSSIHKFSFNNREGGLGGATIDGVKYYDVEGVLIPRSDLDWQTGEVIIHRGDTYYKIAKKWIGGVYQTVKVDPMTGDEAFMYFKTKLQARGFKDLSGGGSSAGLVEYRLPAEETAEPPKQIYGFSFHKSGGFGLDVISGQRYVDINGILVPEKQVVEDGRDGGKFKANFHDNGVYYAAKKKNGKSVLGQKLTGAQAFNYLVDNVPTNPNTLAHLYRQTAGANSKIPGVPNVVNSQNSVEDEEPQCKPSVYNFAFRDRYNEFQRSVTVDGEKFYVSQGILIPYKAWGWDGIKIVLNLNKADTFYRADMKWRGSGTQYMYYAKGASMTGEEVFNTFKDHFHHFGFQDRSCGQASDSKDKKCHWKKVGIAPIVVCEGDPGFDTSKVYEGGSR